jgi:S-adenosylmethionine:tRNA ribosyltransferase-isomerase
LEAVVVERQEEIFILRFEFNGIFEEVLNELGKIPLPKYIKKELKDGEKYQTIYAKTGKSSAAPTAGLHFTEEIFETLKKNGVEILDINLNIGLGTFAPI